MNKKLKFCIASAMLIINLMFITGFLMAVYGFVDGNNNGRDDVLETWDFLNMTSTDSENQQERYMNCKYWGQIWNGSSCHLKEK